MTRRSDSANGQSLMRVLLAAMGLSALSFAAGVAGDLSVAAQSPSVVVPIPPLPANAVRAHPLPPLTDAAEAAESKPLPVAEVQMPAPRCAHHGRHAHAQRASWRTSRQG